MNRIVAFGLVTGISLAILSSTFLARAESTGDRAALARALQGAWLPLENTIAISQSEGTPCPRPDGFAGHGRTAFS